MDRWDVLLVVVAGYVAVVSLVRLMANRRNDLIARIQEEIVKQRAAAEADALEADQQSQDAA